MSAALELRLDDLEARLSLADDQIDQLNLTIFRQQTQMDRLQEQLRLVWQQLQVAPPAESRDLREEIPPHY